MASECSVCGAKLGMGRRLSGKTLCETHEAEQKARLAAEAAAREAAEDEYYRTAAAILTEPDGRRGCRHWLHKPG